MISSRWTDDDLLYVLAHTNGDFSMAVNAIIRHEATGRPPAELIHLLSGGRRRDVNGSSSSPHRGRRRSDPRTLLPAGLRGGGGGLHRNRSEGAVVTSSDFVPPPSVNLLRERGECGRYRNPLGEGQRNNGPSPPSIGQRYAGAYDRFPAELQTGMFRCLPSKNIQPIPPPTASGVVKSIPQQNERQNFRQRHIDEDTEAKASEEAKHQQMLNMQSGIEASLKETRNPSETDSDIDDEALAYAVKASKETFDEEYRKQEVRNALERRIVNISLVASLANPVKKSEEELVGEAVKRSLTDPIPKSEEQLFEEAREKSLDDIERLEVIMKSEEELVEVAKQKSLHTMSKEEELLDDVKRQSLKDAHKDPLWRALEESLTESLEVDTSRRLTSSTHLLSYGNDGFSDCSSCAEPRMPSRFDSPLNKSDLDLMDGKMPALDLPAAQDCEEDHTWHRNRSNSSSCCSSNNSVDFLDRKMTAQELLASQNGDVLSSSSLDLLDRKMSAADLHASQNDAISSLSNPSDYFSSAASTRSADQHSKGSRTRKARCLSVDGASLSLINGIYTEEVDKSNMFTLRVGLDDRTATVASIFQATSRQGKREWVLSLLNSNNFPPETELEADVILYTAAVDNFNDELPSPSTKWVSRNAMVLAGSPPHVTEL